LQRFESRKERAAHNRSTTPCSLVFAGERTYQNDSPGDTNPEDGITQKVVAKLKTRKKADNVKEWSQLWALLFGEYEEPKPKGILPSTPMPYCVDGTAANIF